MECLLTKLKGTVNDSSLLKLGECLLHYEFTVDDISSVSIELTFDTNATLTIVDGDNDFYDESSLSTNIGKSYTFTPNVRKSLYLKKNTCSVLLTNKYNLTYIRFTGKCWKFNLDDLAAYITSPVTYMAVNGTNIYGTLASFIKLSKNLTTMGIPLTVNGNLDDIPVPTSLQYFYAMNGTELPVLDVSIKNTIRLVKPEICTSFTAYITTLAGSDNDISQFSGFTKLVTLQLYSIDNEHDCTGDIAVLANMTELTTLRLLSSHIYGDIKNLANSKLSGSQPDLAKNNKISGDLSYIPAAVTFISFQHNTGEPLTWTASQRASTSAEALAVERAKFASGELDKFLIDNAKCNLETVEDRTNSWEKLISVDSGDRTSASDSAIETLRSAGFTVYVPSPASVLMRGVSKYGIAYKDKELLVEPVNLSTQNIYPANGVILKEFNSIEEANNFILSNSLIKKVSE